MSDEEEYVATSREASSEPESLDGSPRVSVKPTVVRRRAANAKHRYLTRQIRPFQCLENILTRDVPLEERDVAAAAPNSDSDPDVQTLENECDAITCKLAQFVSAQLPFTM
jgi:hypothetical protein